MINIIVAETKDHVIDLIINFLELQRGSAIF